MATIREYNPHLGHKDEIISQNLRLVHKIANRYKYAAEKMNVSYEDIFSEGCVGLLKAFDNYDPSKFEGVTRFSTYAVPMIAGEIQRFLRDKSLMIRFPRSVIRAAREIETNGLEHLSPAEISRVLGYTVETAAKALKFLQSRAVIYADQMVSGKDNEKASIMDMIPAQEDYSSAVVEDFLNTLPALHRKIVILRMEGYGQAEIGRAVGKSQIRVSRLLNHISGRLRSYLGKSKSYKEDETMGAAAVNATELTKEKYLELREQGYKDAQIIKMFNLAEGTFYGRKKRWKLTDEEKQLGKSTNRQTSQSEEPRAENQEDELNASVVEKLRNDHRAEIERYQMALNKCQEELQQLKEQNDLLRRLLKTTL
jgi:RNA polymerase sigma factor (sigma-70 family)